MRVKVSYSEELATHADSESCVYAREGVREALTGERIDRPSSGENPLRSADALVKAEGHMGRPEFVNTVGTSSLIGFCIVTPGWRRSFERGS